MNRDLLPYIFRGEYGYRNRLPVQFLQELHFVGYNQQGWEGAKYAASLEPNILGMKGVVGQSILDSTACGAATHGKIRFPPPLPPIFFANSLRISPALWPASIAGFEQIQTMEHFLLLSEASKTTDGSVRLLTWAVRLRRSLGIVHQ